MKHLLIFTGLLGVILSNPLIAQESSLSDGERDVLVARIMKIGMENNRSSKEEDSAKIACFLRERTGSRVKDLLCGTNAALDFEREASLQGYGARRGGGSDSEAIDARIHGAAWMQAFGSMATFNPEGPLLFIEATSRGKVQETIDSLADHTDKDGNYSAFLKGLVYAVMMDADGMNGISASDYASFIMAYRRLGELENEPFENDAAMEQAMVDAIQGNDLSIDQYNSILDTVMADQGLRDRVIMCLKLEYE